jgi:predicted transcriptional regulator
LKLLAFLHFMTQQDYAICIGTRHRTSALGRDYRRVHEDVEALEDAGLLERDKDGLRADYDAFDVRMRMAL